MQSTVQVRLPSIVCAVALASAFVPEDAQAKRLGGAFRAVSKPVPVRAMPNFNTATASSYKHPAVRPAGPINMGFAPGHGRIGEHQTGAIFAKRGKPDGYFISPNLRASRGQLGLPDSYSTKVTYYRATAPFRAPTGTIGTAYGQKGGATQVVLNQPISQSPLVRTHVPDFRAAASTPTRLTFQRAASR
jgi:hypothetical protein